MRVVPEIAEELERRVSALGFELVDVRWGGSGRRPLLQLRIDRPEAAPGAGVTVDDCASVSRALEPWLDEHESLSDRYTLEVSSPGVDRPLVRPSDFERFSGEQVVVQGREALVGEQSRLEGELLGWVEASMGGEGNVRLRLSGGDEVDVPVDRIRKANLVFTWK
ncbi:MAG: ribosome maturation factor RimP [Gemmatimonadota bacterium]|nr:ribosome maturation factor RimP [Gemmatimonadota bacterium]